MATGEDLDDESQSERAEREPACRQLSYLETSNESKRRKRTGVLLILAGIVLAVLAWSAASFFRTFDGGSANSNYWGTAQTQSCEQLGPLSRMGVGSWWDCSARVQWSDQTEGTVEFKGSELTPSDIGKPVRVTAENNSNHSTDYYRDTTRPLWVLFIASTVAVFAFLIGSIGMAAMRFIPFHRWLLIDKKKFLKTQRQYQQEGRTLPTSSQAQSPQGSEQYPPPQPPPYRPGPRQQPPAGYGNGADHK